MGNFTKSIKDTFKFDGDEITVTMNRLEREDYFKLSPNETRKVKQVGGKDDGKVMEVPTSKEAVRITNDGIKMLPTYVTDMSGLMIDGKEEKDVGAIVNEAYFSSFLGDVLMCLSQGSKPSEEEVKKLGEQ